MTRPDPDLRSQLLVPLQSDRLELIPLDLSHWEDLQAACAADSDIWPIYATSFAPDRFEASFKALIGNEGRLPFAVVAQDRLIGMSAYLRIDESAQTLEIGNSYLAPPWRGTGLNGVMKQLMIDHAFSCGIRRIEFRIDARNQRSQAATRKIGAVQEGLLRAERVTWTGHVRDTCLFGLLREDWAAVRGMQA